VNKLRYPENKVCPSFPYTQEESGFITLQRFLPLQWAIRQSISPVTGLVKIPNPEFFVSEPPGGELSLLLQWAIRQSESSVTGLVKIPNPEFLVNEPPWR
jgi:hypothetical protein